MSILGWVETLSKEKTDCNYLPMHQGGFPSVHGCLCKSEGIQCLGEVGGGLVVDTWFELQ